MSGALDGALVLVPRGGAWGESVAARLREHGASPVIAPLIEFAPAPDPDALDAALSELENEEFDWVVFTSATTIEAIGGTRIPEATNVAAVGDATAHTLTTAGVRVDFQPEADASARAMVDEWPVDGVRVLIPHSELAAPTLADGLRARGNDVVAVTAYRNLPVPVAAQVAEAVRGGDFRALFVTSGSVARQVAEQLAPVPSGTIVVCIGPRTAEEATAAGLRVDLVADRRSIDSMIDSLIRSSQETP
ncbi:uroporphyrinogen-III synthase [Cryobacterium sp. BB307]|uniref:uroporphyrinogen-III synthase n=1 Tax=Cryobacterium sp. BB307 TaxID=2716317 RepID=UPI0014475621